METVISELGDRLAAVAERFASCRLGLFLHGSHARNEAGPHSDIDVLGLCDDSNGWQPAQDACLDALRSRPWSAQLDLKVIEAESFAVNPWVDLRRARWLAGFAWHEILPERTLDQAGRESLVVLGVLFEDGVFRTRDDPPGLAKGVGRLCSVLAALIAGSVPQSATDAMRMLGTESRLSRELAGLRRDLRHQPDRSTVPAALGDRARSAADDVAAVLRVHIDRGLLGPICSAAGEDALLKYREDHHGHPD